MKNEENQEFFTVKSVAKMVGRTTDTVRGWVKYGKVPGFQDTLTNRYLIAKSEVKKMTSSSRIKPVKPKSKKGRG